jgi:hypothetical protein
VVHVSAAPHAAAVLAVSSSLASASAGTLAGAALGGLVVQAANASQVNVPAMASMAAGLRLADQLFPSQGRDTSNPNASILMSTVRDAFERVLGGQLLLQFAADHFDSLYGDEISSSLSWQDPVETTVLVPYRGRRDLSVDPTSAPPAASPPMMDRTVLDRYFAQTSDDTQEAGDDE